MKQIIIGLIIVGFILGMLTMTIIFLIGLYIEGKINEKE